MVDVLLAAGADVSYHPPLGGLPLLAAVENQHRHMFEHLVDAAADSNCRTVTCWTPLHITVDATLHDPVAPEYGWPPTTALTRLLLARGADPVARDERGQTPLDVARHWPYPAAEALLREQIAAHQNP